VYHTAGMVKNCARGKKGMERTRDPYAHVKKTGVKVPYILCSLPLRAQRKGGELRAISQKICGQGGEKHSRKKGSGLYG